MKRILVVDDDLALRQLVTDVLQEQYAVTAARNGAEALELLRRSPPDAIILDMMMPVMDGRTFLEIYHGLGLTATVPVVVVSAELGACQMGMQLGARAFIRKPFDFDRLASIVEQLFTRTPQRPQEFREVV